MKTYILENSQQLDVWDNLLIRACKKEKPSLRKFKRILGWRSALDPEDVDDDYVIYRLMSIIETFEIKTLSQFIELANPSKRWRYGGDFSGCESSYNECIIATACSIIALTRVDKFPGFKRSCYWRNKEKNS